MGRVRHGLCCPTKRASRPSRTPGQRDTEAILHPGGGGSGGALPQTPEQKYRLIYLSVGAGCARISPARSLCARRFNRITTFSGTSAKASVGTPTARSV